jgi:putative aldouronate transport system substrate-binding protein
MKGTKWLIAITLIVTLALPLFAGGQDDASAAAGVKVNPKGVLPVVSEKITISVFRNQDPLILDYEDNYQTKWMEEQTNVNVEWMLVPSQQIAEKMNLLLASGTDLPDVWMQGSSNTTILKYGEEGIFLPLNEYIDEYAFELTKIIADLKGYGIDMLPSYTAPNGEIYGIPSVNTCKWCETIQRSWVDTRWLEAVGLDLPTTIDEFYDMLVAFKNGDPNGNGKADEMPAMGARTGWGAKVEGFLMFPFIVYNAYGDRLILDDDTGKVTAAYTQPEYLDGIKYIKKLIDDGLLDPVSLTQTNQELKVIGETEPAIAGVFLQSNFQQLTLKDDKYRNFEAIAPLKGVTTGVGQTYANTKGMALSNAKFMMSSTNPYPAASFRWADFQYGYDNSMLSRYALKDEDWVAADTGTLGPFGDPAVFKEVGQWGEPTKNSNRQMFMYLSYDLLNGLQMASPQGVPVNSDAHYVMRTPKYMDVGIANSVPRIFLLPMEVDEYGELSATLTTYVSESFARFVTGDLPLSDWDKFQGELKNIGVDRFIEMTEKAYDRQYNQ